MCCSNKRVWDCELGLVGVVALFASLGLPINICDGYPVGAPSSLGDTLACLRGCVATRAGVFERHRADTLFVGAHSGHTGAAPNRHRL